METLGEDMGYLCFPCVFTNNGAYPRYKQFHKHFKFKSMSVKIVKSKNQVIFEKTKKEGLLCLALEESKLSTGLDAFQNNSFGSTSRKVAFVFATQEQFNAIFASEGVAPEAGTELRGRIQVIEGTTPVNAKDPLVGIKYPNAAARTAKMPCTIGGAPIYRKSMYDPSGETKDILVAHDNGAAISAFVVNMNKANAGMPSAVTA